MHLFFRTINISKLEGQAEIGAKSFGSGSASDCSKVAVWMSSVVICNLVMLKYYFLALNKKKKKKKFKVFFFLNKNLY